MKKQAVSFLLKVNYRIRSQQYELRRLAQAALDAAEPELGRAHKDLRPLREFLRGLDQMDMQTWNRLVTEALSGQEHGARDD